ncbi:thioesterase II family protein [Streptomyces beijiangensis]|uniref:Thioesterase n=1 Tax=Streptomyces beijiangensis TaxID=163361 RepID=A0A939JGG9_9ACTN|nr:alpha/beta fold hydrolase [Streptomyces beijiangensis]MBO0510499.1 thioesterase [Streptomyces beijiangensis]
MRKADEPLLRLFVFHHSGGSHLMYRDWPSCFPAGWEVRIPDAPGRGPRDVRPPLDGTGALLEHFLDELDTELTGRFAFFGHSMGGLVAYELTRRLIELGRTPPVWLGVSARGTLHPDGDPTRRHLLSDAELREELTAMGGTSSSVLDHQELWDLFAPTIRADLRISETWRTKPLTEPLPVPLSVFGGTRDQVAPPHRLDGWSDATEHFLGRHLFDGGHFYFQGRLPEVAGRIQDDVRRALLLARVPSGTGR